MSTNKQEQKPGYETPKVEDKDMPKAEYQYQEYQPITEYEPVEYWAPEYEDVQKKYSGDEYAQKQYASAKDTEVEGQETADYLVANWNNNTIESYEGNDVIEASYGNDKIDAGDGDDWLWGMSQNHNPEDKKYSEEEYMEVDWYTGGKGKDVHALGTEKYAHYATNGAKDYAIIADYTAEDTVMLHGTAENYVVGESAAKTEDLSMMEKAATIYWDKDENGSYSEGDDLVAVFEGYSAEELTTAKDSWMYVKSEAVA